MAGFSIEAPPRGKPRENENEEERLIRERWERRIQEEEKKIRGQRKQNNGRVRLTMEQRIIQNIICQRARSEGNKQNKVAQRKRGEESEVNGQPSIKVLEPRPILLALSRPAHWIVSMQQSSLKHVLKQFLLLFLHQGVQE